VGKQLAVDAEQNVMTQNKDSQAEMTPARALELLKEGHQRFVGGKQDSRDLMQQVQDTRGGQWPFAVVLGCIDSRASAEVLFDQGIGDIFSIRVAGNIVNEDILGSMEFACKVAGAKLVLVAGHTRCGAVMGACDNVQLGHVTNLVEKIGPALKAVAEPSDAGSRNSKNADFVQDVAVANVHQSVAAIRERSSILSEMESEGAIQIVPVMYDVQSGELSFL